jgi:hypothetical protein
MTAMGVSRLSKIAHIKIKLAEVRGTLPRSQEQPSVRLEHAERKTGAGRIFRGVRGWCRL